MPKHGAAAGACAPNRPEPDDEDRRLRNHLELRAMSERYALVNSGTGKRLAVQDGGAVLEDAASGPAGREAQWLMSTTGDGTWTLVNAATGRLLDVAGHATADGSRVTTWTPTSNANQRWTVTDETTPRT